MGSGGGTSAQLMLVSPLHNCGWQGGHTCALESYTTNNMHSKGVGTTTLGITAASAKPLAPESAACAFWLALS